MKPFQTKLLAIAAVCAAPFMLAGLAYLLHWAPGDRGNYGELVAPRGLSGPPFDALRGKWVLISVDAAACDAYCEKKLYFIRQVRRAQGNDMARIERLWLVTDGGKPRRELLGAIEGTQVAREQNPALLKALPGDPRDHIYLVDPLGNLMMRFPRDPDPARIIKDLQRLLKYSRVG